MRAYQFKRVNQETLLGYSDQQDVLVLELIALGSHENFTVTLKANQTPSSFRIRQAASVIHQGGVVAYPTEAVFGLGADPFDAQAVHKILAIKRRPWQKGLILIAATPDQLDPFVQWPAEAIKTQLLTTWQSWQKGQAATTFLLPKSALCPPWISGESDEVAVRVTGHPVAKALCLAAGSALVSTSANRAGQPSLTAAWHVRHQLGDELAFILGGRGHPHAGASKILRPGTGEQLR